MLFLPTTIYSQIELHPTSTYSPHFQVDEALIFRLQNHSPTTQRVYFLASLKNTTEILTLQSVPILLTPGGHSFQVGEIPVLQVQGPSVLPAGVYTLCIIAIQEDNRQELGRACVTRRYEQSEIQEMGAKDGAKNFSSSPIKLGTSSGQVRLTAQYSNQTQDFSGIPPNFVRLQASPQLSLLGIPLQGRIFLSTEAERFRYDLNTVSLNLNQHQLLEKV